MDYLARLFRLGSKDASGGEAKAETKADKLKRKLGLEHGSAEGKDGTVKAGWATLRGKRPCNEDKVYCQFHPLTSDGGDATGEVGCLGVFDGHGGAVASAFVRDHVFQNLLEHELFQDNLCKAVEDAYVETDGQYMDVDSAALQDDGCTAITAVLLDKRLVVAHVGDSRGVLAQGDTTVVLTDDHKPNRKDERSRIENAGGQVVWAGTWRVSGVLAVSRSFGNRQMKQFIIPHPDIREDLLTSANTCLVLATDGLWDVMENHEAINFAQRYTDAEQAARALVMQAYSRGSVDNISCVVAFFGFKD